MFLWDTSKLDQRRAVKKFNFKRFFLCVSGSCTSVCNWFLHETWHTWLKSFTYCFVATLEFFDLQWSSWCLPKSMSDDASASLSSWDPKGYPISSSLIFGPLVEPHDLFSHLHRRVTTSKTLAFVIRGTSPDTISCSQGAGWLCLRPCLRLWCYAHVTFSVVASPATAVRALQPGKRASALASQRHPSQGVMPWQQHLPLCKMVSGYNFGRPGWINSHWYTMCDG